MAYEEPSLVSKEALYASLNSIVSKEIERDCIDPSGGRLGSGQFGEVFRGVYTDKSGKKRDAAIKMLRPEAGTKEHVEFLREAAIMGQWDHKHIVQLYGYVTVDDPPMIVIEIADGSISDRLEKTKCDATLLMRWAHEACLGLCYLASRSYIHRDIACRNILLVKDVAKIADFGRSRELDADIYEAKAGVVPVRWTAPEALALGKYSTLSDVWSYGVTLYELWTQGEMPYDSSWSNVEVFGKVHDGWRLPPPPGCPRAMYALMIKCWHPIVDQRPAFRDVEGTIRNIRHSKSSLSDTYEEGEGDEQQLMYIEDEIDIGADGDESDDPDEPTTPLYSVVDKTRKRSSDNSAEYASPADSLRRGSSCSGDGGESPHEMGRGSGSSDFVQMMPSPPKPESTGGNGGEPQYQVPGEKKVPLYDPKTGEVAQEKPKKRVQLVAPTNKLMERRSPDAQRKVDGSSRLQKRTSKWLDEWNARKDTIKAKSPEEKPESKGGIGRSLFKRKGKNKGKEK